MFDRCRRPRQPTAVTSSGPFDNRMRFPLRVLRAIRQRVGPDYIVGIRMAIDERLEEGIETPVGLEILRRLKGEQLIDFVNVIRGNIVNDAVLTEVIPIHGMPSAPHLDFDGRSVHNWYDRASRSEVDAFHCSALPLQACVKWSHDALAQMAEPHSYAAPLVIPSPYVLPCVGATSPDRIYHPVKRWHHNEANGRE